MNADKQVQSSKLKVESARAGRCGRGAVEEDKKKAPAVQRRGLGFRGWGSGERGVCVAPAPRVHRPSLEQLSNRNELPSPPS